MGTQAGLYGLSLTGPLIALACLCFVYFVIGILVKDGSHQTEMLASVHSISCFLLIPFLW